MMRPLTPLLLLLWALPASAQNYLPGQSYQFPAGCTWGVNCYVQVLWGNLPLVLDIPHDGTVTPVGWPTRTSAACDGVTVVLDRDLYAMNLASEINTEITAQSPGQYPFFVRFLVARSKVEVNRPIGEGACHFAPAEVAWQTFHGAMALVLAEIATMAQGPGLVLDIHNHVQAARQIHLGYRPGIATLGADSTLDAATYASVYRFSTTASQRPLSAVVRDLGTRLTAAGYPTVPSDQDWTMVGGETYFNGAYLIQTYGCHAGSAQPTCAIQLEAYREGLTDTTANRHAFAVAFVPILRDYLAQFGVSW